MKGRGWIVAGAAVLLCVALGLWIFAHLEKGERQIFVGYQGEARYNEFLAAQRLLEKMGSDTKSLWRLPNEEDLKTIDALVLPRRGRRLSPGQTQSLLAWVERGGLLLAEGAWAEEGEGLESQDPLFAAFGVRKRFPDVKDTPKAPSEAQDEEEEPSQKKPKIQVSVGGQNYQLELSAWAVLEHGETPAAAEIRNRLGTQVLVFKRGKGQAVLMTSLGFLANDEIAAADHAPFLVGLAEGYERVAIVVREEAPSLLAWLKQYAQFPLMALALLTGLTIWWGLPRFGPRIPDPSLHRRSLLEHLAACGRFQWRHRDGRSLLKAAREAMMARLQRVHPAWAALPPDQLCARLATFSGLSEARIFQALRYDTATQARDFIDAIQTLDFIRKKL
jgi:hypothetical protein